MPPAKAEQETYNSREFDMDIHEYQAKELLAKFGVPIPRGALAYSPEQATYRATEIGGNKWVVKAQIHSGARGKAGGIKVCSDDTEIQRAAENLLGKLLVTHQTGPAGKLVSRLYIEEATDIAKEIYLAFVMDRATERIMVVASAAGGMEIEEISINQPETIIRVSVDPAVGMQRFQAREVAYGLGVDPEIITKLVPTIMGCYRAFRDLDATMVEINPLVVTKDKNLFALDAKMSFDDNALFRRPHIAELRDKSQEDPRETYASDRGLAYVGLDGNIGCVVNGAGLAMATLDMIKLAGGEPANFLDIGGGASPERVAKSFKAVLRDKNVKTLLLNVFAGINRCDWVAKGVVDAVKELDIKMPIIVRLAGTNVEEGRRILDESGLSLITAETLAEAAEKAVAATKAA
jgi:malate-CoA ligase subunit beta